MTTTDQRAVLEEALRVSRENLKAAQDTILRLAGEFCSDDLDWALDEAARYRARIAEVLAVLSLDEEPPKRPARKQGGLFRRGKGK